MHERRCGEALADYLRIRRQLGFEPQEAGRLLEGFVEFAERAGAERITTELALAWATMPVDASPHRGANGLGRSAGSPGIWHDRPASEVPSEDLLPAHRPRVAPYIYSEAEIAALMDAAGGCTAAARRRRRDADRAVGGHRGAAGEALGLDRDDVDLHDGAVHVRAGKQGKQREVPLHGTTARRYASTARRRDRYLPEHRTPALFISPAGSRLTRGAFNGTFAKLIGQIGLEGRERAGPRDRTTSDMASRSDAGRLVSQAGEDVDAQAAAALHLPRARRPGSTYWYLQAAPELLALARDRLERAQELS